MTISRTGRPTQQAVADCGIPVDISANIPMDARVNVPTTSTDEAAPAVPRAKGSARGLARREELLRDVADDLAVNGIPGFSLRRAARAAGTTHKVLLYHFDSADDLLACAIYELRLRRAASGAHAAVTGHTLAERVMAVWPLLITGDVGALGEASGLAVFDPQRFGRLGREATDRYLPMIEGLCPAGWEQARRCAVAHFVLATLRGLLGAKRVGVDETGVLAGLEVLRRVLELEELGA